MRPVNSDFNIAVHGLVYLSHKAQLLSSEALAENICTNPARVRKVMAKLGKAGLVQTREGRLTGGYQLAKPAGAINLRQICEAVDTRFAATSWKSGDPDMKCLVASGMAEIMDGIYQELDALCKQRLQAITVRHIEEKIFGPSASNGSRTP